ncbi:MAG: ABC transporter substrate-binding protein [Spirochaetes bacterium]|nr:ABC transporter substrate-binding protein [Spirochaetota bacterium]MBU0956667.1 ABC transporter substrate-binding protein [Spirochaetota bacterium]
MSNRTTTPGRPAGDTTLPGGQTKASRCQVGGRTALLAVLLPLLLFSCRPADRPLNVAGQHGLAYLPLAIMQTEGLLDTELAGRGLPPAQWQQLGNATAIREAMLAGRLDIGFMGLPPFLIGADKGTGWKLFSGLSEAPLGLVSLRPGYTNIADLTPADRIALPQPGSIQHLLLAMAADRQLGDAARFDDRLVSMGHPEGLSALLSGRDIAAHFTAPPYLQTELEQPGARLILSGEEAFSGRFTFIAGAAAPDWPANSRQQEAARAFSAALHTAIEMASSLQAALRQTAPDNYSFQLLKRLATFYKLPPETLTQQLLDPQLRYSSEIRGLEEFAAFMYKQGQIKITNLKPLRAESW